jgi:hypothetical protein
MVALLQAARRFPRSFTATWAITDMVIADIAITDMVIADMVIADDASVPASVMTRHVCSSVITQWSRISSAQIQIVVIGETRPPRGLQKSDHISDDRSPCQR